MSKMAMKKITKKELERMFALCDKAIETARNIEGVALLEFNGLNTSAIEKVSTYLKGKNNSGEYFIMELRGATFYEAHIKYKK